MNDVYDENIIVALYHDRVENSLCGDVDGDGSVDCPNALSVPMWVGAGYDVGNDFSIKDEGQFQMLSSSTSAEGNRHLQIASDSGVYISSRNDRMWWAWPDANQNCNDGFDSLGYGQNDGYFFQTLMAYTSARSKSRVSSSYLCRHVCKLGGLWVKETNSPLKLTLAFLRNASIFLKQRLEQHPAIGLLLSGT